MSENCGLCEREFLIEDKGFLKEFSPANLPQPRPNENLKLLISLVDTMYSLVKNPVPAKSSKPIAILGRFSFLDL